MEAYIRHYVDEAVAKHIATVSQRNIRRNVLQSTIKSFPLSMRAQAWELASVLDEKKFNFTLDGRFIPRNSNFPIAKSSAFKLMDYIIKSTEKTRRLKPIGLHEFVKEMQHHGLQVMHGGDASLQQHRGGRTLSLPPLPPRTRSRKTNKSLKHRTTSSVCEVQLGKVIKSSDVKKEKRDNESDEAGGC